jgi:hypothetical protein
MWRSVFLHEFLDHRLDNYQALPGTASHSLSLTSEADGSQTVAIHPGAAFEHRLSAPLQEVIGISCRVRLMYPLNPLGQMFPVMQLGSNAELLLWPETHPLPGERHIRALVRVFVGGQFKNLGNVELPVTQFEELRFDWHTSGQARILMNGRLVAYHNALAPGAVLGVDRVVFGMPGQPPGPPLYRVARVFVRLLERPDALGHFARLLPTMVTPTTPPNRCAEQVTVNVLEFADRLRQFMASVHQQLSQPWTRDTGPSTGPFRPEAIEAHNLAVTAMTALAQMMRASDYSSADRFLDPLEGFLRIFYAVNPARFKVLADEIDSAPVIPDDCRAMFAAAANANELGLMPLVKVLAEAADRIRSIAGGN